MDAKDAILQMLDRDLDEAEEQFQMALRNHLIHVDDLIDLQNSRLRGLHEEFERDVRIIKEEFDIEKKEISDSHNQERQELKDLIKTIEEEETNKLTEMKDTYDNTREEIKNMNVEDLEGMKHDLIKQIEELDNNFEVSFNKYMADTEQKSLRYRDLIADNKKNSDEIDKFQRKINATKTQTQFLTLKIQQNKKECEERNQQLYRERTKIMTQYKNLKKAMNSTRDKEEKRLGDLTTNSKKCMDRLKEYQALGTKILKTAELCRKLETEKEKVLPLIKKKGLAERLNTFYSDLNQLESLFSPYLMKSKEEETGYDIEVQFRGNKDKELYGSRIISWVFYSGESSISLFEENKKLTWNYGDPVKFEMRFAADTNISPYQEKQNPFYRAFGKTSVFSFSGNWSLFDMINMHKITEHPETIGEVLKFEFPVQISEEINSKSNTLSNAKVFLKIILKRKSDGKTLAIPSLYPEKIPQL